MLLRGRKIQRTSKSWMVTVLPKVPTTFLSFPQIFPFRWDRLKQLMLIPAVDWLSKGCPQASPTLSWRYDREDIQNTICRYWCCVWNQRIPYTDGTERSNAPSGRFLHEKPDQYYPAHAEYAQRWNKSRCLSGRREQQILILWNNESQGYKTHRQHEKGTIFWF